MVSASESMAGHGAGIAAHGGWPAVVRELVRAGSTIDQPNVNGASPLFIAAENGHAVRFLHYTGLSPI